MNNLQLPLLFVLLSVCWTCGLDCYYCTYNLKDLTHHNENCKENLTQVKTTCFTQYGCIMRFSNDETIVERHCPRIPLEVNKGVTGCKLTDMNKKTEEDDEEEENDTPERPAVEPDATKLAKRENAWEMRTHLHCFCDWDHCNTWARESALSDDHRLDLNDPITDKGIADEEAQDGWGHSTKRSTADRLAFVNERYIISIFIPFVVLNILK